MQINTDLTGLFGITLTILTVLVQVRQVKALPLQKRVGGLVAAVIILSIPLWGVSLAGFLRGIIRDVSITTLVLLALTLVRSFSNHAWVEAQNRHTLIKAILITAVLFYPFALGLTLFDPYRLGYGNLWFMLVLLGLAAWSSLRYSILISVCIALAVAAWSIGWYESPNLWDYLLDPWLAIYALGVQGKYLYARWRGRKYV